MVIQQILYFILIFFSLSVYGVQLSVNNPDKCTDICTLCGGVPSFIDNQCDCQFTDGYEQGEECITNLQKTLDSNPDLVEHIDLSEERSTRCALGSRRHLVKEDANKVAKYFLNGGPAASVVHFTPATYEQSVAEPEEDCDYSTTESDDSDDFYSDNVGAANPTSDSKQSSKNVKWPFVDNSAYRVIQTPSYVLPTVPTILGSPQYFVPHIPLTSRIRPRVHPMPGLHHLQTLQNIPQHLFRFAKLPVQSLFGLSNLLTHGLTSPVLPPYNRGLQNVLGSAVPNPVKESSTHLAEQDHDTEIDKSRNRQTQKNIANRRRTEAATTKPNSLPEEKILGAPAPAYLHIGQHSPLLNLINPTYGGYVLQLVPGDQHNPLTNTIVGSPYMENLPFCREPTTSNVMLPKSNSPDTNNNNDSTDDATHENDRKRDEEKAEITRYTSDQQIERR